jgi:hypothetical protein
MNRQPLLPLASGDPSPRRTQQTGEAPVHAWMSSDKKRVFSPVPRRLCQKASWRLPLAKAELRFGRAVFNRLTIVVCLDGDDYTLLQGSRLSPARMASEAHTTKR